MKQKTVAARKTVSGIRARSPEEKQAVREQILRNAIELYRETGYQGFSMRKLATRTGFSASSLYRYFDQKEAVFAGLVDMGFRLMEKQLAAASGDNLKAYLKSFAQAYLNFALSEPELYKLMTTDHPPTSVVFNEDTTTRRWRVFASLGERAEKLGLPILKSTVENSTATDTLWAFGHGLASLAISLPYFDENRMNDTLAFVFNQVDPFIEHLLSNYSNS